MSLHIPNMVIEHSVRNATVTPIVINDGAKGLKISTGSGSIRRIALMTVTRHRQFQTGSGAVFLEENFRFVFYQRDGDEVGESKRAREAEKKRRGEVRTRIGVYKARFAYRTLIVPIYLVPFPLGPLAGFSPFLGDDPRDALPNGVELSARSCPGSSLPEVRCAGVGITVSYTQPLPTLPEYRKSSPNGSGSGPFLVDATID